MSAFDQAKRVVIVAAILVLALTFAACLFMAGINLIAMVFSAVWLFVKATLWLIAGAAAIGLAAWLNNLLPRKRYEAPPSVEVFAPDAPLPVRRPAFTVVSNDE
jgi:hypothetical protein